MKLSSLGRQVLALLLVVTFGAANSGSVEQADILGEPQMQVADGSVNGCGYRLTSAIKGLEAQKSAVILDTSFNLYKNGLGLVKGGAIFMQATQSGDVKKNGRPIESFWLKVQSKKPTAPINAKVIPAETKGYLLYGVSVEAVVQLFDAVVGKIPLTIGMRLRGEGADRIYTGTVQVSADDVEEGKRCFVELARAMQESQSEVK